MIASTVLLLAGSVASAGDRAAQDSDALARAGTAAIETGRFGDALEAFTRAAALRPGDASSCFGAGVAAFMLGRNELAQARFECALTLKPDHLPAARWLGDLHYRAGRLRDAIAIYESAARRSPGSRDLRAQLTLWRRELELERRFHEVRSDHFTAVFERSTDEPLARLVVDRLEAAYWRVGGTLGVYPSGPIPVVLYTPAQFRDITGLASWSAAGYDGRIRLPLDGAPGDGAELDRVLSHEYVHAVVAIVGGRTVPAWVNEGLATVLEPAGSRETEAMLTRIDARPALTTLHRGFSHLSRREAAIAYATAARAVRGLIERRGPSAFSALLNDLARGEPFAAAFHFRMAMRYEDFVASAARD